MPNVHISGAGLVGSLLAICLQKRGYQVTVFEKRKDMRKDSAQSGRSINLVVTSRGLNALKQVGLSEAALKLCVPVYGRMIHNESTAYQPYGQKNECNYSISRSDLNKFLMTEAEKAGAKIIFQSSITDVDVKKKSLTVFNEGTSQKENLAYELLFGTDGAGSPVRKSLLQTDPATYKERIDWLEADYKELHMPALANGESPLQKTALHIWPRRTHMLMALANLDNSFTMTMYLPKTNHRYAFDQIQNQQAAEQLFQNEFKTALPLMPDAAEQFVKNPQGALGTVRMTKWNYEGSLALMGDAAHAIVPFFGQGMNCGFEDCVVLMRLHDQMPNQWHKILPQYDLEQRPNANAIADMAIENWGEMRDKVADVNFLIRKKLESILEEAHPQLYKSRYGMITYTLIPYSIAQKSGQLQAEILNQLCEKVKTLDEVQKISMADAKALLEKDFLGFLKQNQIYPLNQQTFHH